MENPPTFETVRSLANSLVCLLKLVQHYFHFHLQPDHRQSQLPQYRLDTARLYLFDSITPLTHALAIAYIKQVYF